MRLFETNHESMQGISTIFEIYPKQGDSPPEEFAD